jgi:hypothetical protein
MKDYSNYRPSFNDKLYADGRRLFELQLSGVEGMAGYIDEMPMRFVLQRRSNLANQLLGEFYLMCEASVPVHTGSVVKDDKDKVYLVVSNVEETLVFKKMLIRECTHTLSILDENSVLFEIPCYVDANVRLYSLGQDDNKYISTISDEIIVCTPNNNLTEKIMPDDIYTLGKRNYVVKTVQDVVMNGVLVLKMEYTNKQPKPIPQSNPVQPIKIIGSDSIIQNFTSQYSVDISEIGEVTFSIEGTLATIESQDLVNGKCVVKAGDELGKVILWCRNGSIESSKEIKIKSILA